MQLLEIIQVLPSTNYRRIKMNKTHWNFDMKSLIVGFLLAIAALVIFNGIPSRAATGSAIAADENGVYIMSDGTVRYIEKQKCRIPSGCHINTQ